MRWFAFCVWPAVWLFERIVTAFMNWGERGSQSRLDAHGKPEADTLQELRTIAALARTSRLIGGVRRMPHAQRGPITSRSVREIVLPPEHIAMLSLSNSMASAMGANSAPNCSGLVLAQVTHT
jgi:putative hemolysin